MRPHIAIVALLLATVVAARDTAPKQLNSGESVHIVNGKTATPGQFPHQVSLQQTRYQFHFCGGSIISDRWIVSAAHCAADMYAEDITIAVGHINIKKGIEYQVEKIVIHREYNTMDLSNDISLWKTAKKIAFNDYVKAIPLGEAPVNEGKTVVSSGWGMTSYPGQSPMILQYVKLKTLSVAECQRRAKDLSDLVRATVLCVERPVGTGMCKGDSGGPLVYDGKLVGIVSFGKPCALDYPDGFTRVSSFVPWIKKMMEKN